MLYPKENTEVEMGQAVKFIAQLTDMQGHAVSDAKASITVSDPEGKVIVAIPAASDKEGTYRSDAWSIPHRALEGRWKFTVEVESAVARGSGSSSFGVKDSTSEVLLNKYGFWLDAPTLRNIVPDLYGERGDARNGMIRWGGFLPGSHVLPANWVEIHWREGNYALDNPAAVRRFMLKQLGDLGMTPIRDIGQITPMQFKQWNAWRVKVMGQFSYEDVEYVIFFAPEVNETYAIGTTVVLPPAHVDAHELLRISFAVFPELHAAGVAPEPLLKLLPGPELTSPPLGTRFQGLAQPIVLQWSAVKSLASDEYYEVAVDYNDREGNPTVKFTTRETQLVLPEMLYSKPNCHVFNWQVTLMRQTGLNEKGQLVGDPISYNSLYWYVWWSYPPGEKEPFTTACPNDQF